MPCWPINIPQRIPLSHLPLSSSSSTVLLTNAYSAASCGSLSHISRCDEEISPLFIYTNNYTVHFVPLDYNSACQSSLHLPCRMWCRVQTHTNTNTHRHRYTNTHRQTQTHTHKYTDTHNPSELPPFSKRQTWLMTGYTSFSYTQCHVKRVKLFILSTANR